ncbi:MAG: hypothetical protein KF736_04280 [Acidobacteria bacterium]|nr:hypothetical protein [Acidobacteriota bacterium]MCW5948399.1 hypothetical protein [Pyrinomonadaceae bacterium]
MKRAKLKHTRFNFWVWRKLPACKEIVKIITASMDGRIGWSEWLLMKIHLISCDPCVNFVKQVKLIRSALLGGGDRMIDAEPHVHLSEDARLRMKQAIETNVH